MNRHIYTTSRLVQMSQAIYTPPISVQTKRQMTPPLLFFPLRLTLSVSLSHSWLLLATPHEPNCKRTSAQDGKSAGQPRGASPYELYRASDPSRPSLDISLVVCCSIAELVLCLR